MYLVLGFVVSLAIILALSKRNLWISILIGGTTLGLFTLNLDILVDAAFSSLEIDNVLLAIALFEIPIIGNILEKELVNIFGGYGTKTSAIFGPATLGLLPIPGGALLSCPILEPLKKYKSPQEIVAINIWFRHFIFFVYPLSSILIIAVTISKLSLITAISLLFPIFLFSGLTGYLIYIRDIPNKKLNSDKHSLNAIAIIIIAPILQILLRNIGLSFGLATFLAVSTTLLLSIRFTGETKLFYMAKKVKAWNFSLILLAIIFYSEVFRRTHITTVLKNSQIPPIIFVTIIPFLLGFATGRVQLSIAIMIPLIMQISGTLSFGQFVMVYTLSTTGYLMSPAHPCLILSSQYFGVPVIKSVIKLLPPSLVLSLFAIFWGLILI